MERQKRIYRNRQNRNRMFCVGMLAVAALVVLSGLLSGNTGDDFDLLKIRHETSEPFADHFDETRTETVVDLPAYSWYALQTGVFEDEASARQSSLAFQKRGAAGYLWHDGRYRVLASAYPQREDAQLVREQLREQHNIDSYLYAIEFPAVSLRLSGMQGQIDILQAAFGHAADLAEQIQKISVELDRQEISADDAAKRIASLNTQMREAAIRLGQRFASPVPETVQALMECFDGYAGFAETVSAGENAALLGMKLKYQLFETLQHIQKVYLTLNHT